MLLSGWEDDSEEDSVTGAEELSDCCDAVEDEVSGWGWDEVDAVVSGWVGDEAEAVVSGGREDEIEAVDWDSDDVPEEEDGCWQPARMQHSRRTDRIFFMKIRLLSRIKR